VRADGQRVSSVAALRDIIARKKPGDRLSLQIYRGRSKETLGVKLGRQPHSPSG
jgi:S1-C subfamily serine protease